MKLELVVSRSAFALTYCFSEITDGRRVVAFFEFSVSELLLTLGRVRRLRLHLRVTLLW